MTDFSPPIKDIRFVLEQTTQLAELVQLPPFEHVDLDLVTNLLEESGRLAADVIAPTNRVGDLQGVRFDAGSVRVPTAFHDAFEQYTAAGWPSIAHAAEFGGGGFPLTIATALREPFVSANLALSMAPSLTAAAAHLVAEHGSDAHKRTYLPKLVSCEWLGTMNLTESHAGSDVGATSTVAVPAGDGTFRLTGQKVFITYGDHDLREQIIHLVLARLPGAPTGTKGLSLFIVPKRLIRDDGSLGAPNDVNVVSIEHKLGIHGSPTCVMAFGEHGEGAIGELVGEPGDGMRQMFTMMNEERLAIGLQGTAIAERAYQDALAYALERRQGRTPGSEVGTQAPIIEHADVRRMLLTMKACIDAMRILCYSTALAIDHAQNHPDAEVRDRQHKTADLLTPVAKAWCSDTAVQVTSMAIQIHGGMGYVEEAGVAQYFRDARVMPIYEGTNGIQAMDLVLRKLPSDDGRFVRSFIDDLEHGVDELPPGLDTAAQQLREAIGLLREATDWILGTDVEKDDILAGATDYLTTFGLIVGGVGLASAAAKAQHLLESGTTDYDEEFLTSKVALAQFYAGRNLAEVHGLVRAVRCGSGDVFDRGLIPKRPRHR